jgi:hypothetical protein
MIESHISLPKYFVENKLTDFQISGTVLFIERNQKKIDVHYFMLEAAEVED